MEIDWNRLRAFVGAADAGSLSAAARALAMSQPTVSRYVQALEAELGVRLFDRTKRGLALTETGVELLEHARVMAEAASRLSLAAAGRSEAIAGVVRITASEVVATYALPPIVTELRRIQPEIEVELVASNATDNLLQREADIAVRMYRPEQLDVITRKIGDVPIGAYAAHDYIARAGRPNCLEDLNHHCLVGFDRSDEIIRGFRARGVEVDHRFFAVRCDDHVTCWRLVVAGAGIGFSQVQVGDQEPAVERLLVDEYFTTLPMWLAAHAELKTSRRVRRVFEMLADGLGDYCRAATPGGAEQGA